MKNESLANPVVADFVTYYLETVNDVIESVGYIPATEEAISEAQSTVEEGITNAG